MYPAVRKKQTVYHPRLFFLHLKWAGFDIEGKCERNKAINTAEQVRMVGWCFFKDHYLHFPGFPYREACRTISWSQMYINI